MGVESYSSAFLDLALCFQSVREQWPQVLAITAQLCYSGWVPDCDGQNPLRSIFLSFSGFLPGDL